MAFHQDFVDYDFTMGITGNSSNEEVDGAVAIEHSFGRGQFREVAEKFVIPEPVLEDIIKRSGQSSWSDNTCDVGGATSKMGGVRSEKPRHARGVGRARALRMRAEHSPLRSPGRHACSQNPQDLVTSVSVGEPLSRTISRSCNTDASSLYHRALPITMQRFPLPPVNAYRQEWPSLQQAHLSTKKHYERDDTTSDDSSVIILDSSSSQEEAGKYAHKQIRSIEKKKQRSWQDMKYQGVPSPMPSKPTSPQQATFSTEEDKLGWSFDEQTLCLANLPGYVTVQELKCVIESSFGEVTNCTMFKQYHSDNVQTAYIRMLKQSTCASVIGYFDGNTYDTESTLRLTCHKLHTGHETT